MMLWQKHASAQWLAANEALLHALATIDLAIISRPRRLRSLVQVTCHHRAKAEKMVREFGGTAQPLPRNWWSEGSPSQRAQAPIRIGRRLEIVSEPSRSSRSGHRSELVIPAAGAFGTGQHATTAMSLRLLEAATRDFPRGWRLLDAGSGTGILALAARRFGAGEVLGLDNDSRAVAHARHNTRLNHIACARFIAGDVLQWKPAECYDVITANLYSELLIAALPVFRLGLRAGGNLILSGILREQAESVILALGRAGFQLKANRRRGKWVALLARLEGSAPSLPRTSMRG